MKETRGHEEFERTLRRALHAHAAQVHPSPDALDRIRRRTRPRRLHPARRVGLAAAVAAAVAAVVVLPAVLRDGPQHSVADRGADHAVTAAGADAATGWSVSHRPTPVATTPAPPPTPTLAPHTPTPAPSATLDAGDTPRSTATSTNPTAVRSAKEDAVATKVYSVTNVSTAVGYALAGADGCASCAMIVKTTDSGQTWSRLANPPSALDPSEGAKPGVDGVWGLRFADEKNGWLFGSVLYATHDGGRTWAPAPIDGRQVRTLEVYQGVVYAAVASCDAKSCHSAALLGTPVGTDDWKTVLKLPATAPEDRPSLSFGQGGGGILRVGGTTWVDEGKGWSTVSSPQCPGGRSAAASAVSGRTVFVFCLTSDNDATMVSVWRSDNAGRSWAQSGAPAKLPAGRVSVTAASPSVLAIATDSSALQVSFDGGKSWAVPDSAAGIVGWSYLGARSADLIAAVAAHTQPGIWSSADGGHTWSAVPLN